MPSLFFTFLQIALRRRDCISISISTQEWEYLFTECKRQALLGIGFIAVHRLHQVGINCPKHIALQWAMLAERIKSHNRLMTRECSIVSLRLNTDGFESCILKGQGNLLNYPKELGNLRQSGDIDIWIRPIKTSRHFIQETITYAESILETHAKARYHHVDIPLSSLANVEVHYRLAFLCNPWYNFRFQKWSRELADSCMHNHQKEGFSVPTTSFNVIYQLTHIFRHFFEDGIGLRQLLDYYFVLKKYEQERINDLATIPLNSLQATLRELGLWKFSQAIMWCLAEVFEDDHTSSSWKISPEAENQGKQVLKEIMLGGNFGQYDKRVGITKQNRVFFHAWWKTKRISRFILLYPQEVLSEPFFRLWHYFWRRHQWWRF